MKQRIDNKDYAGIRQALSTNPGLANEELPYDHINTATAHPLHRICDAVFSRNISDNEGVEIAKIFIEYGAKVDGNQLIEQKDTPLVAACSLHADAVAMLYIDSGANIQHAGCHGGTALHWAAWCGRDKVVARLLQEGADVHKLCVDFKATPLFWAIHGLKSDGKANIPAYLDCARLLLQYGADKNIPNEEGKTIFEMLGDGDEALKELLK